jgi:hypothetical protein
MEEQSPFPSDTYFVLFPSSRFLIKTRRFGSQTLPPSTGRRVKPIDILLSLSILSYLFYKIPPRYPVLSQFDSLNILTSCVFKVRFNITPGVYVFVSYVVCSLHVLWLNFCIFHSPHVHSGQVFPIHKGSLWCFIECKKKAVHGLVEKIIWRLFRKWY